MKRPLVSIIIVNWNGGDVFEECLASLKGLTYKNYEIIVVDNGSKIKPKINPSKAKIIYNNENLGFAAANNQGFEISKGDYVLLLNNDTKVNPDLLTVLISKMENSSRIGVIQPKIFLMDEEGYLDNCGSYLSRIGFLEHWGFAKKDSAEYDRERIIFSAKGACMLIRRHIIEKVGLFDSDFGSYFEESDFCWRVWLSGSQILYYPKTHIYHKLAYSAKRMNPFSVNYHSYKNRINSLIKNLGFYNLIILPVHVSVIEILFLYYLIKFHFGEAWIIQKAIWWNLKVLPRTLHKRMKVQKEIRTQSDKEIFKYILHPINFKTYFGYLTRLTKDFEERSAVNNAKNN